MLREDNSPVLIDFGLARRSMDDAGTTGVGQVLGSPYYISPEQSQGQRVDARTDLYSLGVMFYEMLTGQRPYGGRSAVAIMAQHTSSPVPSLPPTHVPCSSPCSIASWRSSKAPATPRRTNCWLIWDPWSPPSPEL